MSKPLVSIVIRTCNRPNILRAALESIRKQTYTNIEVIVVEDGTNKAENMIQEEYCDLNIKYYCMGKSKGRCKTGNYGLSQATGKYINFLDDDDKLYPNHVEVLTNILEKENLKAAYSIAEESQIVIKSENPYIYREKRRLIRYSQPFNRILLCYTNYIPIQSIMFHRDLYEKLGGFDENLKVLEDWDIWVRYSTVTDFKFVDIKTSIYYVPYKKRGKRERSRDLHNMQKQLAHKFKQYNLNTDVGQIYHEMDFIIKQYKTKPYIRYMRMLIEFLMYGDR